MNKLEKYIKHPSFILYYLDQKRIITLSDKVFLKIKYKMKFNKKLDLKNPKTFNEKLQWLKLYDRKHKYTNMVDKYEAKKYVASIIGDEYIIPTIGIYDKFEDIDFKKLPKQFVIKCTHDSGGLIICKDKSKLNIDEVKEKINKSLNLNYYYCGREWPYKKIKPRIIIEKYMEDKETKELQDYKFLCFDGKANLIEIHRGRYKGEYTQDFYNCNWEKTEIKQGPDFKGDIKKPTNLEKMINFSEKIANEIKHVRVDWYEVNGKLYFGEITFYDGCGFDPFDLDEYDLLLGSWIDLENKY